MRIYFKKCVKKQIIIFIYKLFILEEIATHPLYRMIYYIFFGGSRNIAWASLIWFGNCFQMQDLHVIVLTHLEALGTFISILNTFIYH